jgi:flagellar biosynthesis protein FlhF
MKIKRFEATNMSDALRMIKKEFGEEAVILSAKTIKKAGRFFGDKCDQVVVTAAVDSVVSAKTEKTGSRLLPAVKHEPVRRALWDRLEPITRTGREKLRAKFVQLSTEPRAATVQIENPLQALRRRLEREGLSPELSTELIEKASLIFAHDDPVDSEMQTTLAKILSVKGMAAVPTGRRPRTLILVGPCGVGKTTTAAKLASEAALQGRRAALISTDQQRVAGAEELERYARILGIPMLRAGTSRELSAALIKLKSSDLRIIDTPGIGPGDGALRDQLNAMFKPIEQAEVHLLINAALTEKAMQKTIECFHPFAPRHLIFTQADWAASYGGLLNTTARSGLAVSYLSNSPQVGDGLHAATAERLAQLLWPESSSPDAEVAVTVVKTRSGAACDGLVANRNSDIFHRHDCRAVKRIRSEHMITFAHQNEALGQSYKPCRMCCADLYVPKPIHRPALVAAGSR